MGQITGNENSFPTIKQVNDALGDIDGGTLDITTKAEEFCSVFGISTDNYIGCLNNNLCNIMYTLRTGKYNRLIAYGGETLDIPIQIININIEPICIFNWYVNIDKILTTVFRLNTYEFKTVEFDKSGDNSKIEALDFYAKKFSFANIVTQTTVMAGFVVFNSNTNTFVLETNHTGEQVYYGGWLNQGFFGTPTANGVKPIENKIYKETSTGKFYICKSGTLIELDE